MTTLAPTVSSTNQTQGRQPTDQSVVSSNTNDWIVEWTGIRGYKVILDAIKAATPLVLGPDNIVMQYLEKSDIYSLSELETAAGKGDREKGKRELTNLLKSYNPEKPLPFDIDEEMQTPLSKYFDAGTLSTFPKSIYKVTHLFSLYWRPAGVSANISEELAKKHGQQFVDYNWPGTIQAHGDVSATEDCWIQFPNDVFGRNKTVEQQQKLVPAGFEGSHFLDAVFCVFTKYICTKTRILPHEPYTYTRCQDEFQGYKLVVGNFGPEGLDVFGTNYAREYYGISPSKKYLFKNS